MTALTWSAPADRKYETGCDRGVLFRADVSGDFVNGYAWNGLTTVTESPTGAEATAQYADNIKYLNLMSLEEFAGTIEAFTYPDEFAECDGSAQPETGVYVGQQDRKIFGFCYRTKIGNSVDDNLGYKLHMVWNAKAAPSEKPYSTVNDSPEAINFSWEVWTTPIPFVVGGDYEGLKPTSYLCVDSTKVSSADLAELEDFLYGTVGTDPSLPSPDAVLAIFAGALTVATPIAPTYDSGTDLVTIPAVTGVTYKINGVVKAAGTHAITADAMVTAQPNAGYKFPAVVDDDWFIDFS